MWSSWKSYLRFEKNAQKTYTHQHQHMTHDTFLINTVWEYKKANIFWDESGFVIHCVRVHVFVYLASICRVCVCVRLCVHIVWIIDKNYQKATFFLSIKKVCVCLIIFERHRTIALIDMLIIVSIYYDVVRIFGEERFGNTWFRRKSINSYTMLIWVLFSFRLCFLRRRSIAIDRVYSLFLWLDSEGKNKLRF